MKANALSGKLHHGQGTKTAMTAAKAVAKTKVNKK